MEYNILYNINLKKIEFVNSEIIIDKIYLLEYKVPSIIELKDTDKDTDKEIIKIIKSFTDKTKLIDEIKQYISNLEYKMPLYDIYTSNIYIINRENLFKRVNYNYYRFPSSILIDELQKEYNLLIAKKNC